MQNNITLDLQQIVGKGYAKYWNSKQRYCVCKGSKGSKKSKTTALKIIHNIMRYPLSNCLVVRRFFSSHKNSTFAELKWAINRLCVEEDWKISKTPMELTYKPTGQKILFAGLDDADTLASITVSVGFLCWVWIEEAFQITSEEDFDKLNLSIRGKLPEHLWKQIMITFNPWSANHWLKKRFYDIKDSDILAITTTYKDNEFLDEADVREMERIKKINPRRYQIIGKGEWGIAEGLVYRFREMDGNDPTVQELRNMKEKGKFIYNAYYGLDFGFTNDPTAMIECLVSTKLRKIWITWEHYQYAMTNDQIAGRIKAMFFQNKKWICDCAEPKSIYELKRLGINANPSKKGVDSVRAGINKLQDYEIIVNPKCVNTIIELSNYAWDKDVKNNRVLDRPVDEFNHLMDALRYATEGLGKSRFSFL